MNALEIRSSSLGDSCFCIRGGTDCLSMLLPLVPAYPSAMLHEHQTALPFEASHSFMHVPSRRRNICDQLHGASYDCETNGAHRLPMSKCQLTKFRKSCSTVKDSRCKRRVGGMRRDQSLIAKLYVFLVKTLKHVPF